MNQRLYLMAVTLLSITLIGLSLPEVRERARRGDPKAQNNLGLRYKNGNGVKRDLRTARYWLLRSARQNSPLGQYNAAILLDEQDKANRASYWFYQSALRGFDPGQRAFLSRVLNGSGVERNLIEAYAWTKFVDQPPTISGRRADDFLRGILSQSEIKRARERARYIKRIINNDGAEQSMDLPRPKGNGEGIEFETGTAFYVRPNQLVTNDHVVEDCKTIVDLHGHNHLRVLRRYEQYDLALLGGGEGDPLPVGAQDYKTGTPVRTTSYPGPQLFQPQRIQRRGRLRFETHESQPVPSYWIADFPAKEGESGAPTLNANGVVIGVVFGRVTFKKRAGAHTGIIPGTALKRLLGQLPGQYTDSSNPSVVPIVCR